MGALLCLKAFITLNPKPPNPETLSQRGVYGNPNCQKMGLRRVPGILTPTIQGFSCSVFFFFFLGGGGGVLQPVVP